MDTSLNKRYKLFSATDNHVKCRQGYGGNRMRFGPFLVLAGLLFLAWIGGFVLFHVASVLIHVLLVLALLSIVFHFLTGRRTA
jgi:Flp pilus assembly protein TadB